MTDHDRPPHPSIDVSVAHPARRYNYWLGGKDNFVADRVSGDQIATAYPGTRTAARANRAMLQRVVRFLTAEVGIRQFLDIGTGLPTADNTHEVAQRIAPQSRVVYVDNDPLVMTHARALLTSTREGRTDYIEADLREPAAILDQATKTLDFSQPIAVLLVAVLHFIPGDDAAQPLVERLVAELPADSYLAITHATSDFRSAQERADFGSLMRTGQTDFWPRDQAEFAALFNGLELIEPGIVPVSEWRPDPDADLPDLREINMWGAVGRKPFPL